MLNESHSPDHWVLSYPVPDGLGRVQLKWTWQSNVTDILKEWQFVDVAGHNHLHRCLCPLREANEQPWLHGWPEWAAWSYKLMSWDVCGQPAAFEISHLSFQEGKNIGHVFLLPWCRCPSPRTEQTYRFMWCITQLWMCLVCVVSPLGYGFQSNTFKHTCVRTHTHTHPKVSTHVHRETHVETHSQAHRTACDARLSLWVGDLSAKNFPFLLF